MDDKMLKYLEDESNFLLTESQRESIKDLEKIFGKMYMETAHHSFAFRRLKYAVTDEDKRKYQFYNLVTLLQHRYFERVDEEIEEDIRLHGHHPSEEIFRSSIPEDFLRKYLDKTQ
ncbi:hypothetical protein HYV89_02230 [Candidatus Woesearchaeota archaeon]|nr:hypothetical protein [Candidatus Woesearchaeota archaeon]